MSRTFLGLAIDVSASMKESMKNSSSDNSRFDLILDAINSHVRKIEAEIQSKKNYKDDVAFFAFLFGLDDEKEGAVCDFLSIIEELNSKNPFQRSMENPFEEIRAFVDSYGKWVGDRGFLEKQMAVDNAELILRLLREDSEFRDDIFKVIPDVRMGKTLAQFGKKIGGELGADLSLGTVRAQGMGQAAMHWKTLEELGKNLKAKLASGEIHRRVAISLVKRTSPQMLLLSELVTFWQSHFSQSKGELQKVLFGKTPMCSMLNAMNSRFEEMCVGEARRILCLVSDGLPTDGNPLPIIRYLQEQNNVQIVTCYITHHDAVALKTIFANENPTWDDGAKLMFQMASSVNIDPAYQDHLLRQGWIVPEQGKLFFQLNHSGILESVLSIVTAPREYQDKY